MHPFGLPIAETHQRSPSIEFLPNCEPQIAPKRTARCAVKSEGVSKPCLTCPSSCGETVRLFRRLWTITKPWVGNRHHGGANIPLKGLAAQPISVPDIKYQYKYGEEAVLYATYYRKMVSKIGDGAVYRIVFSEP